MGTSRTMGTDPACRKVFFDSVKKTYDLEKKLIKN